MGIELTTLTAEQRDDLQEAIKGSEEVTTVAGPGYVTLNPAVAISYITTAGTDDNEDVYIGSFELNAFGYAPEYNGVTHTVAVKHRTSSGDRVRIFPGAQNIYDEAGSTIAKTDADGFVLANNGANVDFVWMGYEWRVTNYDGNDSTDITPKRYPRVDGFQDGQVSTWKIPTRSGTPQHGVLCVVRRP